MPGLEKIRCSVGKMAIHLFSGSSAAAIYLNFFTHHYWLDIRWWLSAIVLIVFLRAWVDYKVGNKRYRMPIVLSFFLIGFFIWIAENIATFFQAWEYPNQAEVWSMVHLGKVSSWLLLVIVSFLIVAMLKQSQAKIEGLLEGIIKVYQK